MDPTRLANGDPRIQPTSFDTLQMGLGLQLLDQSASVVQGMTLPPASWVSTFGSKSARRWIRS